MLETITGIFSLLAGGAGGGIVGVIAGLWRKSQDDKRELALEKLNIEREKAEYAEAREDREHQKWLLEQGHAQEMEKIQTETEAEIELKQFDALRVAGTTEFRNLNTSTWMDNYRASVRPTVAYWLLGIFNIMLIWAFWTYRDMITPVMGLEILMGLFGTLNFGIMSALSFYFVARKNK